MPIALSFGQHSRSGRFFARGISQYQRDSFLPFALRFVEDPRTGSSLQKKSNEDRFDAVTEHRLVSFDIQDVVAAAVRWRSLGPRSLRGEWAWELVFLRRNRLRSLPALNQAQARIAAG